MHRRITAKMWNQPIQSQCEKEGHPWNKKISRAYPSHQVARVRLVLQKQAHSARRFLWSARKLRKRRGQDRLGPEHHAKQSYPALQIHGEERFFRALWKEHVDRLQMRAGHGKNVGGLINQGGSKWLATQPANIYAFLLADFHCIKTWRLAANRMYAS